jgi:hypothetical protein
MVISNTPTKHVSEYLQNTPSMKDNSALWRGTKTNSLERVNYSGVTGGPQWTPQLGNYEAEGGFLYPASPNSHPSTIKGDRIIAHDLPDRTESASAYDLPSRKSVLQIDVPDSTTKTTSYKYNSSLSNGPNTDMKLHGIETVKKPVLLGRFVEVENDNKPSAKKVVHKKAAAKNVVHKKAAAKNVVHKKVVHKKAAPKKAAPKKATPSKKVSLRKEVENIEKKSKLEVQAKKITETAKAALDNAKAVEEKAKSLSANSHISPLGLMVPINTTNKKDNNDYGN